MEVSPLADEMVLPCMSALLQERTWLPSMSSLVCLVWQQLLKTTRAPANKVVVPPVSRRLGE